MGLHNTLFVDMYYKKITEITGYKQNTKPAITITGRPRLSSPNILGGF
jgi:hypothetical protein